MKRNRQKRAKLRIGRGSRNRRGMRRKVEGRVIYTFRVKQPTQSIFIDAQNMRIMNVLLDDEKIEVVYDDKKIEITSDFKLGAEQTIEIQYIAAPKKALYFLKRDNDYL